MKWFGIPHGASYEDDCERVTTPVGAKCARCEEVIGWHDDGLLIPLLGLPGGASALPYHYECHFRGVVGGLNHQKGICTCCGGTEPPDPPEMTRREAALAATHYWQTERNKRPPPGQGE